VLNKQNGTASLPPLHPTAFTAPNISSHLHARFAEVVVASPEVEQLDHLFMHTGDAIDLLDCTITNITIIISLIRTNAA